MAKRLSEWWGQNYKVVAWIVLTLVIIATVTAGYLYITRDTNPIPKDIRSKLTFSPLAIPVYAKTYSVTDYKFTTSENNTQTLSYSIRTNNNSISLSQQQQPQAFVEIPEYKNRFLDNVAKQYDTVQTANGTIYLGHLSKQNNKQLGIMLEKGLLIFINPDKEMDKAQWRDLGDQLEIQKKSN